VVARRIEALVMAHDQRRQALTVSTEARQRPLSVVRVQSRRVALARRELAAAHPRRDRHREFSQVVHEA
jgi:hypothetical protein